MAIKLGEMTADELLELAKDAVKMYGRRAYNDGYKRGVAEGKREVSGEEKAQKLRDEIVERAKADISIFKDSDGLYTVYKDASNDIYHGWKPYATYAACDANFVVNKEKRVVVALLQGYSSGDLYARGIAKCAPNDCFNVHIGKAIALRRALLLDVPDEYLNAPQPTEVRVGDVVYLKTSELRIPYTRVISKVSNDYITYTNGGEDLIKHVYKNGKIIDDSREEYSDKYDCSF